MKEKTVTLIILHIAVFLAGWTGIFGRLISLGGLPLVWYRMIASVVVLFAVLAFMKRIHRTAISAVMKICGCGVLLALHWVAFFASIQASNVSIGQKTTGRSKLIFTNYRADFIGTLQNLSSISVSDDSAVVLRWDPSSWKNIDAFETVLGGSLTFAASGDCTIDGGFTGDGALIFAGTVTYTLTSDESAVDGSVTLTDGAELRIKHDSFYSADSFALGAPTVLPGNHVPRVSYCLCRRRQERLAHPVCPLRSGREHRPPFRDGCWD